MTRDELAGKSREELVAIASTLNIKTHHKALPETIIKQIMQQPVSYIDAATDPMKHPAERPIAAPILNTPDQVREAIKRFAEKDGFEFRFLDNDTTWQFKCRGAEDSGHMSTALRLIAQRAEIVSRGRVALKGFKDGSEIVMWG